MKKNEAMDESEDIKDEIPCKDVVSPGSEEGKMAERRVGKKRDRDCSDEGENKMEGSNRKKESEVLDEEIAFTGRILRPRRKNKGKLVNGMWQPGSADVKRTGKSYSDGKEAVGRRNERRMNVPRKEYASSGSRMKEVTSSPSKKKRQKKLGTDGCRKSTRKQLVRLKIIDMLLTAGWKIEYRPRNGRDYQDAIYVSPKGRGYWSVTLAYKVLSDEYVNNTGDSDACNNDLTFVPLAEEEIKLLKKTITKRRADVKKKEKGYNAEKIKKGGIQKKVTMKKHSWKMVKGGEKLDTHMRRGRKPMEGKLSGKFVLPNNKKPLVKSCNGPPTINREHKLSPKRVDRKRCTLLVRTSKNDCSDIDNYVPYRGKRSVLAWMIDLNVIALNGKVQYVNPSTAQVSLEGSIAKDGIYCKCCNEVVGISVFGNHAGGELCQASQNMFFENGKSLLKCQLDSWNIEKESIHRRLDLIKVDMDDPNDDTCGACGDGGDLICCDGCPSTFHQQCVDLKALPSDDWHCMHCSCKFCGYFDMMGTPTEREGHGAVPILELLACHMCEEKYHRTCMSVEDVAWDNSRDLPFCGRSCKEIYERLLLLIGVKHDIGEGFSWTFIRRYDIVSDMPPDEISLEIECNSKLSVALSVMDECFLPILDERSGINIIQNIVYNCSSNFTRLNYTGFLTAILEKDDEIISVASVRIHGKRLAEMPFIGTRNMYRRQGMCRRLLAGIESALSSLNVEKLIIPAISELLDTWTSIFSFQPLTSSTKLEMKRMNMLMFPATDMLQKILVKDHSSISPDLNSHDRAVAKKATSASRLPDNSSSTLNQLCDQKGDPALNVQGAESSTDVPLKGGSGSTTSGCCISSQTYDRMECCTGRENSASSETANSKNADSPRHENTTVTHQTDASPTTYSDFGKRDKVANFLESFDPPSLYDDDQGDGLCKRKKFWIFFGRRMKTAAVNRQ